MSNGLMLTYTLMDTAAHDTSVESFRTRELEKAKLKPSADDKHKGKNEKLLNKKRQAFAHTTKPSTLDAVLSAKLALSRQKEVEIYDSHAIDFGQIRKPKLTDEALENAFLPRHLRKRVSSLQGGSELTNACARIRAASESEGVHCPEEGRDCVGESATVDSYDGRSRTLSIISESEDKRKGSFLGFGKDGSHDTLDAFVKYRRDNLDRDRRLRQIQEGARVLDQQSNGEPIVKSLAYRKTVSLPPLHEPQTEAKIHVRKKERHKLPKLKNTRRLETKQDSRFEKLLSSLVPQEKRRPEFHRRHYTL